MRCATCLLYEGPDFEKARLAQEKAGVVLRGNCHRYPRPENVTPEHWCGEWRENAQLTAKVEQAA